MRTEDDKIRRLADYFKGFEALVRIEELTRLLGQHGGNSKNNNNDPGVFVSVCVGYGLGVRRGKTNLRRTANDAFCRRPNRRLATR